MKIIGWLIGLAAALGSAGYLIVYIIRWQWNRALFSGMALVIIVVIMGVGLVLRRLSKVEEALRSGSPGNDDFAADLRATRTRRDHFEWLKVSPTQTNIFITALLGGGAIISGIAWAVGKVAESTTTPQAESNLSARMDPLAFPDQGLTPLEDPGTGAAALLLRGRPSSPRGPSGKS